MATNPRIGQVDRLLDDIQLSREDLHGRVRKILIGCALNWGVVAWVAF